MPPILSPDARKRRIKAITARLERWFLAHQRFLPWRAGYVPYQVWISEVMLQQTRMEVVLPYFRRFLERFPDVASLAAADESEVLSAWSGLGYYRRARMLHQGARLVMNEHAAVLPADCNELRRIPGVGRYTAGAIASIAFERPAPIVDGNIARVLARLDAISDEMTASSFSHSVWERADSMVQAANSPRVLNQAVMELGALICRPRVPLCGECPLSRLCVARRLNRQEDFPRRDPDAEPTRLEIPLYVARDRRGRVLMRRERGRLMSEMFHLPHGNDLLLVSSRASFRPREFYGEFPHTVTHRRIRFQVWTAAVRSRRGFVWIDPAKLADVPHPSYVRKALALLA